MVSQVVTVGLSTVPQGLFGSPLSHFHSLTFTPASSSSTLRPHRLPDARLLHVRFHHTGFVDVGDANGDVQAADAGAVPLLPSLYGNLVAVVTVGVDWLLEVGDFVESEDTAAAEGEVLAVGTRQGPGDSRVSRVGHGVGGLLMQRRSPRSHST